MERWWRRTRRLAWLAWLATRGLGLGLVSCSGADVPSFTTGEGRGGAPNGVSWPFAVDDHFHPTGCMASDGCQTSRVIIDTRRCRFPRPPGAQGQCYRFLIQPLPAPQSEETFVGWL